MHLLRQKTLHIGGVRDASRPRPRLPLSLESCSCSIGRKLLKPAGIDRCESCNCLKLLLLLHEEMGKESIVECLDEGRIEEGGGSSRWWWDRVHPCCHAQVPGTGGVESAAQRAVDTRVDHPRVQGRISHGRNTQGGLEGT